MRCRFCGQPLNTSGACYCRDAVNASFVPSAASPSGAGAASERPLPGEPGDERENQLQAIIVGLKRIISEQANDLTVALQRAETAERERDELRKPVLCGVCLGRPLASGRKCVCGGIGTEQAEMHGLRVVAFDIDGKLAASEQRVAALEQDGQRLDFLEGEMERELAILDKDFGGVLPRSLFRRNVPITRADIDAEIARAALADAARTEAKP